MKRYEVDLDDIPKLVKTKELTENEAFKYCIGYIKWCISVFLDKYGIECFNRVKIVDFDDAFDESYIVFRAVLNEHLLHYEEWTASKVQYRLNKLKEW